MTQRPLYYADYLQLDRLLSLQSPESAKHGPSVHDEMLFIIIHQPMNCGSSKRCMSLIASNGTFRPILWMTSLWLASSTRLRASTRF